MLVYKIVIIKAMERALDKHFFGIFSSEIGPWEHPTPYLSHAKKRKTRRHL